MTEASQEGRASVPFDSFVALGAAWPWHRGALGGMWLYGLCGFRGRTWGVSHQQTSTQLTNIFAEFAGESSIPRGCGLRSPSVRLWLLGGT